MQSQHHVSRIGLPHVLESLSARLIWVINEIQSILATSHQRNALTEGAWYKAGPSAVLKQLRYRIVCAIDNGLEKRLRLALFRVLS